MIPWARGAPRFRTAALALGAIVLHAALAAAGPRPPLTRVEVVSDTLHGVVIEDRYRWLEDQNAPETRSWLAAQDRYFHQVMDPVPGRAAIRERLSQLLRTEEVSLPVVRGDRMFFFRRGPDQDQRVLVLRRDPNAPDRVLLDANRLSRDHSISVRLLDVSQDGTLAAIGLQQGGEDEITVQFLDVGSLKMQKGGLPRARYSGVQFSADAKQVYYSRVSPAGPRAYRHTLGGDAERDSMIFGDGLGPGRILSLRVTDDGAWMLLTVSHGSAGDQVEVYVKDLRHDGPVETIVSDIPANFSAEIGANVVFLKTNWEAPRGRILVVDLAHPEREKWREIIPQAPNPIGGWGLSGGRVLVYYLVNVTAQLYAFRGDGHLLGPVPLGDDVGAIREMRGSWNSELTYLSFETYMRPARIVSVRALSAAVTEWWAPRVPFASDSFETRPLWYRSKDGTDVPMLITLKKDMNARTPRPVYLTGYGGFDVSETPRFRASTAMWLESGGILAVPALRGGGELGEPWHQGGMLGNKQNVFDDFIGAAEFLIEKGWTRADLLTISGGSNGGLLVGAAETQRPDLFRAVVCSFPLLDMIRYDRFLVARYWVPEYGSSEDASQFEYLRAYSPYHHVSEGVRYPATLFVSGDSDTRVAPLHARKMTALLQARTGGDAPVLLHYDTRSGHSGGKALSLQIEDDADVLHFLFWQCGMLPRAPHGPADAAHVGKAGSAGGSER